MDQTKGTGNTPAQSQTLHVKPAEPEAPKYAEIKIDLGQSTDKMTINGVTYFHGHTYRVKPDMVPSMLEIMHNTRAHEAVVSGNGTVIGNRFRRYGA